MLIAFLTYAGVALWVYAGELFELFILKREHTRNLLADTQGKGLTRYVAVQGLLIGAVGKALAWPVSLIRTVIERFKR